jgi:hypothetical protein
LIFDIYVLFEANLDFLRLKQSLGDHHITTCGTTSRKVTAAPCGVTSKSPISSKEFHVECPREKQLVHVLASVTRIWYFGLPGEDRKIAFFKKTQLESMIIPVVELVR